MSFSHKKLQGMTTIGSPSDTETEGCSLSRPLMALIALVNGPRKGVHQSSNSLAPAITGHWMGRVELESGSGGDFIQHQIKVLCLLQEEVKGFRFSAYSRRESNDSGKVAEFDSPHRLLEDKTSMFMKLVSEYSIRTERCSKEEALWKIKMLSLMTTDLNRRAGLDKIGSIRSDCNLEPAQDWVDNMTPLKSFMTVNLGEGARVQFPQAVLNTGYAGATIQFGTIFEHSGWDLAKLRGPSSNPGQGACSRAVQVGVQAGSGLSGRAARADRPAGSWQGGSSSGQGSRTLFGHQKTAGNIYHQKIPPKIFFPTPVLPAKNLPLESHRKKPICPRKMPPKMIDFLVVGLPIERKEKADVEFRPRGGVGQLAVDDKNNDEEREMVYKQKKTNFLDLKKLQQNTKEEDLFGVKGPGDSIAPGKMEVILKGLLRLAIGAKGETLSLVQYLEGASKEWTNSRTCFSQRRRNSNPSAGHPFNVTQHPCFSRRRRNSNLAAGHPFNVAQQYNTPVFLSAGGIQIPPPATRSTSQSSTAQVFLGTGGIRILPPATRSTSHNTRCLLASTRSLLLPRRLKFGFRTAVQADASQHIMLHLLGFIDVPIIGSGSPLSDDVMDLYEKSCDTFALQYGDFVAHKKVTAVGINTEWGFLMASISEGSGEQTPL
ncbi:ABC transporter C family member 5 [Dendrobium catenatum]|uniref:ABC transporter C family member 5 n=1 Tax=Dendrobium catenatum TaxID=906689 RepID=A0A2I0WQJ5_9ASPA|nr:ABC transporter C family member 5 [Dendrobium catenatum]